jgi:hypothetical protein
MRSTEQQLWPVLYMAPSASDSAAALGSASSQHIGRVLAAQLQLQLDEAAAHGLRDARRWHGAGEEHAVDWLLQQRAADLACAHQAGDHHVARHAGLVQQRVISWPVMVAYSDGLYSTALPVSSAGTMTLQPTNQG